MSLLAAIDRIEENDARAASRQAALLVATVAIAVTVYRAWAFAQSGLSLLVDEAQYWYWAQHPAWGYFSKPPVIAWLIGLTTAVCGDGELCVKAPSFLLYPLTTLGVLMLASRLYDLRTGVVAALVFLLLPGITLSAVIVSTDVPLLCCWTWGMYALLRALDDDAWRWWLAAGTAVGIGLLAKYSMAFFVVGAAGVLRRRLLSPRPWVALALALLLFTPNLLWNASAGYTTLRHTANIAHWSQTSAPRLNWNEFAALAAAQLALLGPLLAALGLGLLPAALRRAGTCRAGVRRRRFLGWFCVPLLAFMAAQALYAKANGNWAGPAVVAMCVFVVGEALRRGYRKALIASVALNVVVMLGAYHYHALAAALGVELSRHSDPLIRAMGWREAAAGIEQIWEQHPQARLLAEERDVLAQLAYHLRPRGTGIAALHAGGPVRHHYDLVAAAAPDEASLWLYVSRRATAAERLEAQFGQVQALPPVRVALRPDYSLVLYPFLAQAR